MAEMLKKRLLAWGKRIAIDLAIIYLLCCVFGALMINTLMFCPHESSYSWETPHVVNIGSGDAPVAAMWLPCAGASKTFLYSHGNGEDLGDFVELFESFRQAGFSVLSYDYPGYGMSSGRPSEQGVYATAETAYRFLTERCDIAPADIIIHGRSIGSGPACYLAERFPVGGLVVESGFTSAPRVMTRRRIFPFDPFQNIQRVRNISAPKLFIHGTDDSVVPFTQGKTLFAAARAPKANLWVDGAGHDDLTLVLGNEAYFETLKLFANPNQKETE